MKTWAHSAHKPWKEEIVAKKKFFLLCCGFKSFSDTMSASNFLFAWQLQPCGDFTFTKNGAIALHAVALRCFAVLCSVLFACLLVCFVFIQRHRQLQSNYFIAIQWWTACTERPVLFTLQQSHSSELTCLSQIKTSILFHFFYFNSIPFWVCRRHFQFAAQNKHGKQRHVCTTQSEWEWVLRKCATIKTKSVCTQKKLFIAPPKIHVFFPSKKKHKRKQTKIHVPTQTET